MNKDFMVERDILIMAMRYALGRMTFAPTIAIDNIKSNIDRFTVQDLIQMKKDIEYQEGLGGLGMDCDIQSWYSFLEYLSDKIMNLPY